MTAIDELKNEHKEIQTTLTIMENMVQQLSRAPASEVIAHMEQLIDFFNIFTDKCHHGKEEDVLFPTLGKLNIGQHDGLIDGLLAEHDEGRAYLGQLRTGIEQLKKSGPGAAERIAQNAENYAALLRRHIEKEDTALFPTAAHNLSDQEQSRMVEAFEKIEEEKIGAGKHEELHGLLERLQGIYL